MDDAGSVLCDWGAVGLNDDAGSVVYDLIDDAGSVVHV
jgi:hypothetical protein